MAVRGFTPFAVNAYDNPGTIRLRKYATGAHLLARGVETGQTPKEAVWRRDRVRLYRYEPDAEIWFPVPMVLIYALILRPYVLDLVPGNSLVEYLKIYKTNLLLEQDSSTTFGMEELLRG